MVIYICVYTSICQLSQSILILISSVISIIVDNVTVFGAIISLPCICHYGFILYNPSVFFAFCFMDVALELIEHLRAMGETNALLQRNKVKILLWKLLLFFYERSQRTSFPFKTISLCARAHVGLSLSL